MRSKLAIALRRARDGTVTARGSLAVAPFWCRWDGEVLWLVGSAATPVGEDDITIELDVGDGVRATVRSVAASLIYAARGDGTRLTTTLHVAGGASLLWQPEPVVVTARADHRSVLVADVATGGSLLADELLVLGRSDEAPGRYASTLDLRRDGTCVSLTSFDTAVPGWSGPGGTSGAKVVGTRAVVGPGAAAAQPPDPSPVEVDQRTVILRPEGGGAIATTLASTPDRARAHLDAALPATVHPAVGRPRGHPPT